jgi:hypothetical protein
MAALQIAIALGKTQKEKSSKAFMMNILNDFGSALSIELVSWLVAAQPSE